MLLRDRIEPYRVRIGARDAFEPDRARFFIDVLDRAARHHDLVRRHRGVADEHHFVVVRIFVQHVPGRRAVGEASAILLPHALIEAVVEVEIFHVLEFAFRRREQFLDLLDMGIHRAADVEEHQNLHRIAPLGTHVHVEIAVIGGFLDRGVEIEFVGRAGAGELAQTAQRDLDVADAKLDIAVEVFELAAIPHLHGAEVAVLFLADPHAFRVIAVRAKRRGACRSDPFAAALVTALLLFQALAKRLHELVPAHRLDLLLFFLAEVFFGELLQPFFGNVGLEHPVEQAFQPLEHQAEHAIELVEIALILHQRGAREVIEVLHRLLREVGVDRLHQRQVFAQGHRHLGLAQRCEELQEHTLTLPRWPYPSRVSGASLGSRIGWQRPRPEGFFSTTLAKTTAGWRSIHVRGNRIKARHFMKFTGTKDYVATEDLKVAVNASIVLERPLLIKGEPGTGKTVLAEEVAKAIKAPLLTWHIKSTTKAQQGLYEYDAVSRLRDSQLGDIRVSDISNYIKRGKLWDAFTLEQRPVLLIDEIDKADIEFPNDLLLELDRMEFHVYETGETIKAKQRPIIMITSNNEKELPDAFLRRCFFHYIKFPDVDTMNRIVDVHFPGIKKRLVEEALRIFFEVREVPGLKKKPSTSELLDWLKLLLNEDIPPEMLRERDPRKLIPPLHGALLKNEQDVHLFERLAFLSRREV